MKNIFISISCIALIVITGFYIYLNTQYIYEEQVKQEKDLYTAKEIPVTYPSPDTSEALALPKKEEVRKVVSTGCPVPKKEYEDETYLDVGQEVPLKEKYYIPSDLIKLNKDITKYKESSICLKQETADALEDLIEGAKKDSHILLVSSGFRSFTTQDNILKEEIKNLGEKHASVAVAKPGYSEHQLGVAVDLTSASISYESASGKFADTSEAEWLEEHASEYGFIQSYPTGKEKITGYMYEPWHYRYVGFENAKAIIKNGQTVNEFLKEKKELEKVKSPANLQGF